MITKQPFEQTHDPLAQVAESADHAIKATQRVANSALDGLGAAVQDLHHEATPLLNRASEQASALAKRSLEAIRHSSQQLRDKALRASDGTVNYIKDEPVKAMLIAAATGAALMALISLFSRSRDRN